MAEILPKKNKIGWLEAKWGREGGERQKGWQKAGGTDGVDVPTSSAENVRGMQWQRGRTKGDCASCWKKRKLFKKERVGYVWSSRPGCPGWVADVSAVLLLAAFVVTESDQVSCTVWIKWESESMSEFVGVDVIKYTWICVSLHVCVSSCTILPLDPANKMGLTTGGVESASWTDVRHTLRRKEWDGAWRS